MTCGPSAPRPSTRTESRTWSTSTASPCGTSTAPSSGFAGGGGVIDREGGKGRALEALYEWTQDQIHLGAFDPKARIDVMDDSGIWAQVCFPNSIGLGGQGISDVVKDPELRLLCVQIYNDAMAEVQADSGRRLLPMPVLPAWDVDACVAEAKRVAGARPARGQHHVGPQ